MKTILSILMILTFLSCKKEEPKRDFTLQYHAYCKSSPFKVSYVSEINEKKEEFVIYEETITGNTFDKTVVFNTSPTNGYQPYIEATNIATQNNDSLSVSITINGQKVSEFLRFNNQVRTIRQTVILTD